MATKAVVLLLPGALFGALFAPLPGYHQGAARALPGPESDLTAKVGSNFFFSDSTFVLLSVYSQLLSENKFKIQPVNSPCGAASSEPRSCDASYV